MTRVVVVTLPAGCAVVYFITAMLFLPEGLKQVQRLMAKGDMRAVKIYETIGVCPGSTTPLYADSRCAFAAGP